MNQSGMTTGGIFLIRSETGEPILVRFEPAGGDRILAPDDYFRLVVVGPSDETIEIVHGADYLAVWPPEDSLSQCMTARELGFLSTDTDPYLAVLSPQVSLPQKAKAAALQSAARPQPVRDSLGREQRGPYFRDATAKSQHCHIQEQRSEHPASPVGHDLAAQQSQQRSSAARPSGTAGRRACPAADHPREVEMRAIAAGGGVRS